jgi:glycogenin glucosyltransferase
MSEDTKLFQPPPSYPEAPKNMWYEVPSVKPESKRIAPIFPWETRGPRPTRVFADDVTEPNIHVPLLGGTDDTQPFTETSPRSVQPLTPTDFWQSYARSNAWDEVPEIERYVEAIQRHRKGDGRATPQPGGERKASLKITDFPTEVDRPSLPVTPAPVRRMSSFWGEDSPEATGEQEPQRLPAAEGVPNQEDWVGLTADVFLHLLRAIYSYWEFTESTGTTGRAPTATVPAFHRKKQAGRSRVVRRDQLD